jgi:hypothetical protein
VIHKKRRIEKRQGVGVEKRYAALAAIFSEIHSRTSLRTNAMRRFPKLTAGGNCPAALYLFSMLRLKLVIRAASLSETSS